MAPLERLDFFGMQGRVELVAVALAAEDLERGIQLTKAVNLAINGLQSCYLSPPKEAQGPRAKGEDFSERFSSRTGGAQARFVGRAAATGRASSLAVIFLGMGISNDVLLRPTGTTPGQPGRLLKARSTFFQKGGAKPAPGLILVQWSLNTEENR
jgi:hypothetical protein